MCVQESLKYHITLIISQIVRFTDLLNSSNIIDKFPSLKINRYKTLSCKTVVSCFIFYNHALSFSSEFPLRANTANDLTMLFQYFLVTDDYPR